jgi:hypothetical protein
MRFEDLASLPGITLVYGGWTHPNLPSSIAICHWRKSYSK